MRFVWVRQQFCLSLMSRMRWFENKKPILVVDLLIALTYYLTRKFQGHLGFCFKAVKDFTLDWSLPRIKSFDSHSVTD